MSFSDLAAPFLQFDIPVLPIRPRNKLPYGDSNGVKNATTNRDTIKAWDAELPADTNIGLAALEGGDICFLEFDAHGPTSAAKEMGETMPLTRVQKSGNGGVHLIFRHTERSRAVGNRSKNLDEPCFVLPCGDREHRCKNHNCEINTPHHHHEWFSFRAANMYVLGSGSVHPNGKPYETVKDRAPIPVPDWVLDFVEKHTQPSKPKHRKKDALQVSDDFDFDDFCEHYKIDILFERSGCWQIVEECPGTGARHKGSKLTGFFYDGSSLGWSCFAQGCPTHGMSIGQLLSFMNKEHGRYEGVIWDDDNSYMDSVDDCDAVTDDWDDGLVVTTTKVDPEPVKTSKTPDDIYKLEDETNSVEEDEPEKPVEVKKKPHRYGERYASTSETDETISGLRIKSAADYDLEELSWLWPQKVPKGKMTFFTGKPDCGKSLTLIDLISRVTTGADWPDGSKNENPPGRVLLAASEDDPNDTLVPRLKAAGADLTKVEFVLGLMTEKKGVNKSMNSQSHLDLSKHARFILHALQKNPDITLLCLDPITSFLGDVDTNKDKDVRPVMEKITKLCIKSGITVVSLIHSNKRSDVDSIGKVSGAGSLAAVVRAVWGFSRDTEDKTKFHMAHVKGNLSKDKNGLVYGITEASVTLTNGKQVGVPRIVWGEVSEADADDIMKQDRATKDVKDFRVQAAKMLIRAQKFPVMASKFYELAEAEGIKGTTVKNARMALNKEGFITVAKQNAGCWFWHMLDEPNPTSKEEISFDDAIMDE
jgi:RecA-family ATPase